MLKSRCLERQKMLRLQDVFAVTFFAFQDIFKTSSIPRRMSAGTNGLFEIFLPVSSAGTTIYEKLKVHEIS